MAPQNRLSAIVEAVVPATVVRERPRTGKAVVHPPAPGEGTRLLPPGPRGAAGAEKGGGFRHAQTLNVLVGPAPLEELRAMRQREAALAAELEAIRRERGRLEEVLDLLGVDHRDYSGAR